MPIRVHNVLVRTISGPRGCQFSSRIKRAGAAQIISIVGNGHWRLSGFEAHIEFHSLYQLARVVLSRDVPNKRFFIPVCQQPVLDPTNTREQYRRQ